MRANHRIERNLVVSTRRLNRIVEHEPADLIAVTEAGVTLKDFNLALAQKGQWLPLDPPDDPTHAQPSVASLLPGWAARSSLVTALRGDM